MIHTLREKIASRSLRIGIIGLGYVGLPLAVTFAEAGVHVTGIDVDQHKVDLANEGESYIADIASETLQKLMAAGRLHFTTDFSVLEEIDALSICVPTPLRKTRDPDISYIVAATRQVKAHLHAGQLVGLERTPFPATPHAVAPPDPPPPPLHVGPP